MERADGRQVASLRLSPRAAFGFRLSPVVAAFHLLLVVVVAPQLADVDTGVVVVIVVVVVVM